jgi:hypothetical protein
MKKKEIVYEAESVTLPSLKSVLGDLPEPDPQPAAQKEEARRLVNKLITRIKENLPG